MKKRQLGNTDLFTAPVVIGANVFGWTLDESESFTILDEITAAGFNTIDTADVYSRWAPGNVGGESETIIGNWMKARKNRNNVIVITKVGADNGHGQRDLSEKHILKAVDNSLRRLQTDRIDLYLTHWDDDKTPVEETLMAYQKLIASGKIRNIGASNLSPERLKASLLASDQEGLPRYEVFQPEYNLFDRQGYEEGVADICTSEGLGVISYYSLASGFLSGKYRSGADQDKSVRGGAMTKYLNERGHRILECLDDISASHAVSPAAVALAWLIQKPNVTAPIASATKTNHVRAFTQAVNLELTEIEMGRLEAASWYIQKV